MRDPLFPDLEPNRPPRPNQTRPPQALQEPEPMQPDNLEDDLEDEPEPEPKDYQALLPFPKSETYWMPEDDPSTLAVQVHEEETEIQDREHLINLVEARLMSLVRMSEEPEYEVRMMLRFLDEAGMIDPDVDREGLVKADQEAWYQLFQRPNLRMLMYKAMRDLEFPVPITGNNPEAQELFQDEALEEWASGLIEHLNR